MENETFQKKDYTKVSFTDCKFSDCFFEDCLFIESRFSGVNFPFAPLKTVIYRSSILKKHVFMKFHLKGVKLLEQIFIFWKKDFFQSVLRNPFSKVVIFPI